MVVSSSKRRALSQRDVNQPFRPHEKRDKRTDSIAKLLEVEQRHRLSITSTYEAVITQCCTMFAHILAKEAMSGDAHPTSYLSSGVAQKATKHTQHQKDLLSPSQYYTVVAPVSVHTLAGFSTGNLGSNCLKTFTPGDMFTAVSDSQHPGGLRLTVSLEALLPDPKNNLTCLCKETGRYVISDYGAKASLPDNSSDGVMQVLVLPPRVPVKLLEVQELLGDNGLVESCARILVACPAAISPDDVAFGKVQPISSEAFSKDCYVVSRRGGTAWRSSPHSSSPTCGIIPYGELVYATKSTDSTMHIFTPVNGFINTEDVSKPCPRRQSYLERSTRSMSPVSTEKETIQELNTLRKELSQLKDELGMSKKQQDEQKKLREDVEYRFSKTSQQLNTERDLRRSAEIDAETLKHELDAAIEKNKELQDGIGQVRLDAEQKTQKLKVELIAADKDAEQLKKLNTELDGKYTEARGQVSELSGQLKDVSATLRQYQDDSESHAAAAEKLQEENAAIQQQLSDLSEQLSQERGLRSTVEAEAEELKQTFEDHKNKLDCLQGDFAVANSSLADYATNTAELEAKLCVQTNTTEELQQDVATLEAKLCGQTKTTEELQQQLATLQEKLLSEKQKTEEVMQQNSQLRQDLVESKALSTELRSEYDVLQQSVSHLEAQLAEERAVRGAAEEQLLNERQAKEETVQMKCQAERDLEAAQTQLAEALQSGEHLTRQCNSLKESLADVSESLQELRDESSQRLTKSNEETEALVKEKSCLQRQLEDQLTLMAEKEAELESTKQQLGDACKATEELEKKIVNLQQQAESEQTESAKQNDHFQTTLQTLRSERNTAQDSLARENALRLAAECRLTAVTEELHSRQSAERQFAEAADALQQQIDAATLEADTQRARAVDSEAARLALEAQLVHAERNLQEAQRDVDDLRSRAAIAGGTQADELRSVHLKLQRAKADAQLHARQATELRQQLAVCKSAEANEEELDSLRRQLRRAAVSEQTATQLRQEIAQMAVRLAAAEAQAGEWRRRWKYATVEVQSMKRVREECEERKRAHSGSRSARSRASSRSSQGRAKSVGKGPAATPSHPSSASASASAPATVPAAGSDSSVPSNTPSMGTGVPLSLPLPPPSSLPPSQSKTPQSKTQLQFQVPQYLSPITPSAKQPPSAKHTSPQVGSSDRLVQVMRSAAIREARRTPQGNTTGGPNDQTSTITPAVKSSRPLNVPTETVVPMSAGMTRSNSGSRTSKRTTKTPDKSVLLSPVLK